MKFFSNNLTLLIDKIKSSQIRSLVIYGQNKGLIDEIVKKMSISLRLNFSLYNFDNELLFSILNNRNLFSEKEISIFKLTKNIIDKNSRDTILGQNQNFPIFICDELQPSSELRKFFETNSELAIIACYLDDQKSIRSIILNKAKEFSKIIDEDSVKYISSNLQGDRLQISNELNKLFLYVGDKKNINIDDVKNIISISVDAVSDEMPIAFLEKNYEFFFEESNKLILKNIPLIWILRALARFYTNLLIVKLFMISGLSIDISISKLRPPIFFKYIDKFKLIVLNNSIDKLYLDLEKITKCEIDIKNNFSEDQILTKLIL